MTFLEESRKDHIDHPFKNDTKRTCWEKSGVMHFRHFCSNLKTTLVRKYLKLQSLNLMVSSFQIKHEFSIPLSASILESSSHNVYILIIETTLFNMWNIVLQPKITCTGQLRESDQISNRFVRSRQRFPSIFREFVKAFGIFLWLLESIYESILFPKYSMKRDWIA